MRAAEFLSGAGRRKGRVNTRGAKKKPTAVNPFREMRGYNPFQKGQLYEPPSRARESNV